MNVDKFEGSKILLPPTIYIKPLRTCSDVHQLPTSQTLSQKPTRTHKLQQAKLHKANLGPSETFGSEANRAPCLEESGVPVIYTQIATAQENVSI